MGPSRSWQEVTEVTMIKYIVCMHDIFEELIKYYFKRRMFYE